MDIVKLSIDMPWDVIGESVAAFISGMFAQKCSRKVSMHFADGTEFNARGYSVKEIEQLIKTKGSYYVGFDNKP